MLEVRADGKRMENHWQEKTIGILYPGEMGSSLATLLCDAGYQVVTTLAGRSSRTCEFSRNSNTVVLGSLAEVVERSDVLISVVVPAAAVPVARAVAECRTPGSKRLLYLDANSISPGVVSGISDLLQPLGIDYVDAAIFGLASRLRERGALYLSGRCAPEVAEVFASLLRVKVVGDQSGQASALKMIVSGIPKGLSALFVEAMLFAEDMHLLEQAVETCTELYPSLMEVISRMLPTYQQHAARRCEELQQVEDTMLRSASNARMIRAAREVTSDLAATRWPCHPNFNEADTAAVIRLIHQSEKPGQAETAAERPVQSLPISTLT